MLEYLTVVLTLKHIINDIPHAIIGLCVLLIIVLLCVMFGGKKIEDGEECLSVSDQFEPNVPAYLLNPVPRTNHITKCCMNCGVSGANENYLCTPCSKLPRSRLIFNQ